MAKGRSSLAPRILPEDSSVAEGFPSVSDKPNLIGLKGRETCSKRLSVRIAVETRDFFIVEFWRLLFKIES